MFDLVKGQLGDTATQASLVEDSTPANKDQPHQEPVPETCKQEEMPNEVQELPEVDESIAEAKLEAKHVSEELPPSSESAIVSSPEPLASQEAPKEEA